MLGTGTSNGLHVCEAFHLLGLHTLNHFICTAWIAFIIRGNYSLKFNVLVVGEKKRGDHHGMWDTEGGLRVRISCFI